MKLTETQTASPKAMKTFLKRLSCDVPLMTVNTLDFIIAAMPSVHDVQAAEHPYFKQLRAAVSPKLELRGDYAIVPVQGTLAYNPDPFEMLYDGVEDSRSVLGMMNEAAAHPDVKGVLLRMDTPGGMLLGGPEMADAVARLRSMGKPVVAHAGGLCCSLGYMIASQATEIIANRSAIVGSIGVISSVTDYTEYLSKIGIKFEYFTNEAAKFKAAGAIGTSLTDAQREQIKAGVESAFTLFKDCVNSQRPHVKAEAMQGQTFRGAEAKQVGLVDRIGDENFAVAVLRSHMKSN